MYLQTKVQKPLQHSLFPCSCCC